jgi:ubiquitin-protein ligase
MMTRLVKEITSLTQNYQPNFYFFPTESNPQDWKLVLLGPTGCPYEGYTFVLSMQFPADYPFHPPNVRFITPIYHCNVNKTGKICHSVLSHNWSPAITVKEVMIHLNNMLIEPNIDDQIENSVAQDYYVDRSLYLRNLEQSCKQHASLSLEERLAEMGMKLEDITLHHPPDYMDPVTKNIMMDPVTSAASGYSFERATLLEHVRKNGTDPITNKPLLEAQITSNDALKKTIQRYMACIKKPTTP